MIHKTLHLELNKKEAKHLMTLYHDIIAHLEKREPLNLKVVKKLIILLKL